MVLSPRNIQQEEASEEFVLQKHVAFFDRNHDGIIYPWETFQGFRAIGSGIAFSTVAALLINISLSAKTCPIKNIHLAKIGNDDRGAYDSEGRFVPTKLEEMFTNHAHTHEDALTGKEVWHLLRAKRAGNFINEWVVAFVEWIVLFSIAKDKNSLLQKDTFRAIYDGSLFERMEKERSSSKKKD
ncbi:probable peroxygenase 4 isoform X2 [Humulus lupulus]|uniref:probable peroxygenase 4 isoform X2 n=1 Tax=Humulus lupulus TaxID=3486 RepID=UPI002B411113|nr:probable peroxygenase 4 isoform X2 [Humulus lupulus]